MSVLAYSAPADNHRPISAVLQNVAVIALSVYLCVGVSWWFLPLSVLLLGGVGRLWRSASTRTYRPAGDLRGTRVTFAEVPTLAWAGGR